MKTRNPLKELASFFGKLLLSGICCFLFALMIIKHNEIHDLIFNPTSGLIVTYICIALIVFLAGYVTCFFTKYRPAQDKASTQREILERKLENCSEQLANAEEWINYYKSLLSDNEVKHSISRAKSILDEISDLGTSVSPSAKFSASNDESTLQECPSAEDPDCIHAPGND